MKAGVSVVPGYDGVVESLEQALELCNDMLGYPVLLKALAGGGGKGMRVCYNDKDIKEAWGIAKSEGIKFFSDDRLLLEKFIEKPHHIEFQVMSAPSKDGKTTDVAVFPERECSIQRSVVGEHLYVFALTNQNLIAFRLVFAKQAQPKDY